MGLFGILISSFLFFSPMDFDSSLSLELLIQKLASKSELDHAVARQLLPLRNPIEVFPRILPFLDSEEPDIKGTARNILFDLANEAEKWGGEVRKDFCTLLINAFIDQKRSTSAKGDILKALVFAVNEEIDLSVLKDYLLNEEWREKVRVALVEANTISAKRMLCESLDYLDDKGKISILLGFYQLGDALCEEKILALLSSSNSELRANAVLVLSNIPLPAYAEEIFQICIAEPEISDYYQQNWDSLLRITEKILQAGGNWDYAIEMYKKIIKFSASKPIIYSAIVGLGRYGDDRVAEFLTQLVITSEGEMRKTALYALSQINSRGIREKLLDLCNNLSFEEQAMLIPVLLREENEDVHELISNILSTPTGREKFINSFWEHPDCGYIRYLSDIEKQITEAQKNKLIQALWRYVSNPVEETQECVGKGYLLLYRMVSPDEKSYVMMGLKKFPILEMVDVLSQNISKDEYSNLPFSVLFEFYNRLPKEDLRRGEIETVLISQIKNSSLSAIVQSIGESKYLESFPSFVGFINSWKIIGPFPWSFEEGIERDYGILEAVKKNEAIEWEGEKFEWKSVKTKGWGYVDLMELCKEKNSECSNICAFALANLYIHQPQEVFLLLGSDDGFRLWVNGEFIGAKNVDRGMTPDEERIPIKLQAGLNSILLQVTQIRGGWNFCVRLVDSNENPLKFEIKGSNL